ncbi:DUF883 family protein [Paraburkholderia sp.]|uniref:DUF883 family protein n=1 Tax=Paraburkholderia sp. TaxID=1926495 RepID=UPI003D6E7CCB
MSISSNAAGDPGTALADAAHASGLDALDAEKTVGKIRTRLKRAKDSVREKAADAQVIVVEKGRKTARAADGYVHDKPWTTAGVALGVGVLIGMLISRR